MIYEKLFISINFVHLNQNKCIFVLKRKRTKVKKLTQKSHIKRMSRKGKRERERKKERRKEINFFIRIDNLNFIYSDFVVFRHFAYFLQFFLNVKNSFFSSHSIINLCPNFSKLYVARIDSRNVEQINIKTFITFNIHYRISRFLVALNICSTFFDIYNLELIFASRENVTKNWILTSF